MIKISPTAFVVLVSLMVCIFPPSAQAYVGPGAGLSAIGAFLALIAGIVIAIFGFIFYPIKRLMRKFKKSSNKEQDGESA